MLVNIENLELFCSYLDILPIAIVVADASNGSIIAFNKEAEVLWKRSASEVVGKQQTILHPPQWNEKSRETFSKDIETLEAGGIVKSTRNAAFRSDGIEVPIEIKANMVSYKNKHYIVGIFNSIKERVHAYDLLEEKEKEVETIFENAQVGILYLQGAMRIVKANQRFLEIFGYDSISEIEGKSSEIFHRSSLNYKLFTKRFTKALKRHEVIQLEYEVVRKDGSMIWVSLSGKAVDKNNPADLRKGMIWIVDDISEKHQILNELQKTSTLLDFQAHYDTLTSLPNRTLFSDRLQQAIEKAKRAQNKFAVFCLDLDRFKELNDSFGHEIGDVILLEVTKRLKNLLRAEDTLARMGGDAFTILYETLHKVQDIVTLAQKLMDAFKEPFCIQEQEIYITCSVGIATFPDDTDNAQDLFRYAENAMYKAKDEGRNNFQFYKQEMTEMAFERLMLESNIRQAIKRDEFCIYYQGQYDAVAKRIVGMEALIRWEHPTLGHIAPSKFIPFAEESGLIVAIDNWVMEHAFAEIATWRKEGIDTGILSLNLAIKQLESEDFLERIKAAMARHNFDPTWLKLEILERDVMNKPQENIAKLKALKDLGIVIALDDFGVGQSSLNYLKELPIDYLKIDQSFVRGIDSGDNTILLAIIALAEALGLETIAEGVEKEVELEFLLQQGCRIIQGYYFYRPVASQEYKEILLSTQGSSR